MYLSQAPELGGVHGFGQIAQMRNAQPAHLEEERSALSETDTEVAASASLRDRNAEDANITHPPVHLGPVETSILEPPKDERLAAYDFDTTVIRRFLSDGHGVGKRLRDRISSVEGERIREKPGPSR